MTYSGMGLTGYGLHQVYAPATWIFVGGLLLAIALGPPLAALLAGMRRREP